ncbi:hypothetical protein DESUT3_17070 [Desulfuromonas versatilis]|uniref:Prepilin-type N-terminal cleavage/methylation domain-containing protein n=1 Tax=Desulfuromonas versatilis TaxID=2802975 RepID=A0ABN6DWX9_9BACT|nr:prepilin-type N-terminal cleavage/methylation domain-containing protein [Desulfuromonas versatilis]BCR04638.1 hypothetical protein DESUT3_17070 [Desulfuromonas versatilis]
MLIDSKIHTARGFSLIELLVVMAILGLVTMATVTLYTNTQRTANTSEEVVDVQQNLRIGLEVFTRDVRLAGLLVPSGQEGVSSAPEFSTDLNGDGDCSDAGESPGAGGDCFSIQAASATGRMARIDIDPPTSPSDTGTQYTLTVATADMVDLFNAGSSDGDWVRIIRPQDSLAPLDRIFRVFAKDRANERLTLTGFNAATEYAAGDVIVRVIDPNGDADGNPNTNPPAALEVISYRLQDDPTSADPAMRRLVRRTSNSGDSVVAEKITDLQLSYIMDDGPDEVTVPAARLGNIVAIRVAIEGATDATKTGMANYSGVKTRRLESVIKLRNR